MVIVTVKIIIKHDSVIVKSRLYHYQCCSSGKDNLAIIRVSTVITENLQQILQLFFIICQLLTS